MSRDDDNRRGLTLIEVVVLIVLVILLIGLLLPSIHSGTPTGRTQCLSNLRNLASALKQYEISHGRFPGYKDAIVFDRPVVLDGNSIDKWPIPWPVAILRELQRNDLYMLWKEGGGESFLVNGSPTPIRPVEILTCPASPLDESLPQPLSYAVNAGMADVRATADSPADNQANGMFFNRFCDGEGDWGPVINGFEKQIVTTSIDYVQKHDGLSTTILLSENRDNVNLNWFYLANRPAAESRPYAEPALGIVWWANPSVSTPKTDLWQINGAGDPLHGQSEFGDTRIEFARPSSNHRGGVVIGFCDESVRLVSDSIDYSVYCQMMSPHGAAVAPPAGSAGVNQSTFEADGYAKLRGLRMREEDIP